MQKATLVNTYIKISITYTYVMTLTLTSPAFGGWTVMVSATRGCFGPRATMALHVMGSPSVDMVE